MKRFFAIIALVCSINLPARAAAMTGGDILKAIGGKTVYLKTPFGGEFPLNYRATGRVDGDGEALGLGRWMRPTDRGRWWVEGDRLCQQFTTWYDGTRMCFALTVIGPNRLKWVRDNGEIGTARIGA
jgi:hypothetical protein